MQPYRVYLSALALVASVSWFAPDGDPPTWWAYQPLIQPDVPSAGADWAVNEIDRFVAARLAAAGLEPNGRASDATLIRRATYDLTGLPPSPEQVADYVADRSEDKYERLIDRLLDSDQYGVKWGRHWLDLVRFAETDSYERDRRKPNAWRYRDWVVDAVNADVPYGDFVTRQLAGDELEDAKFEDWVATGYYRLGIWDDEPTDRAQAVYDDFDGVIDTTARSMLGVSIGCARCHDHKKDPIPQRDYYRMLAFFENVRPYQAGGGSISRRVPLDLGRSNFDAELTNWERRRTELFNELGNLAIEARDRMEPDVRAAAARDRDAGLVVHLPLDALDEARGKTAGLEVVEGRSGPALQFRDRSQFDIDRPVQDDFTIALWFKADRPGHGSPDDARWFLGSGLVDGEIRGIVDDFGISLVGDRVAAGVGRPETFVKSARGYADGEWHHVAFTRDRDSGRVALYVDGLLADSRKGGKQSLTAPKTLSIGRIRPGGRPFHGQLDDVRIYDRPLGDSAVLDLARDWRLGSRTAAYVADIVGRPEGERFRNALAQLVELRRPTRETAEVLCVQEAGAKCRDSFVRLRGNVHAKGEKVTPGVPEILGGGELEIVPPTDGESAGRRLAFARWLTKPDHPLTWRVVANRVWQHHFGRGIVRTPDEFGQLGEKPTHPKLLDWLATEFVRRGQSLKAMHRLLMTSATYRMASASNERALEQDPRNDLFWRYDMRRLTAEEVRDSILAVSGNLNLQTGGPGIYPKLPREVLATASRPDQAWGRSSPEQAARRSLYIFIKRSLLHPLLTSFDMADTDNSCPVRFVTTLPTQALTMLNSDMLNEQAGIFAKRLMSDRATLREQVVRGFELVGQRPVSRSRVDGALSLIAELQSDEGVDLDEARRLFCLTLLNLNEFVYLD